MISGDLEVVEEVSLPHEAPAPDSSLASLLPPEAAPDVSAAPASLPPPVKAVAPVAEAKRIETGTLGFKAPGDNGFLRSGYKLMYAGASGATACVFTLIGKETLPVTLDLNETKTVSVEAKGGKISITLTYKGARQDGDGTREVDFAIEGGVAAVSGVMERFRKVGPLLRSAGRKFLQHLPEVITVGFAAGLAVCGLTLDWVRQELGRLHPYVTVAVPVAIASLAAWSGFEREKHIKKEMESSD